MVGLIDLAPSTRTIRVGGEDVAVFGVSAQGIAALLQQFPELQALFMEGDVEMSPDNLMKTVPKAVAAVIAAGCGYPGDPKAIEVASKLAVANQFALLKAILELTMPEGVGPFMEALNGLVAQFKIDAKPVAPGKAPASK